MSGDRARGDRSPRRAVVRLELARLQPLHRPPAVFVGAALIAAFYYWGWDVSSNLNEETKNGRKAAGRGGIIGVIIVFLLFEVFTIAVQVILPAKTIADSNGNLLSILGDVIWPGIGGKILIIAVALSTIATLETTLIQVTRTLFAMGRDHTIPLAFGRRSPPLAHPRGRDARRRRCLAPPVRRVELPGQRRRDPRRRRRIDRHCRSRSTTRWPASRWSSPTADVLSR